MKNKLILALAACSLLTACNGPVKVGSHVESLEVVSSRIDEDAGELYVTVKNDRQTRWEVNLGGECAGYPFTNGQQMLIRFDDFKEGDEKKAGEKVIFTTAPQQEQIFKVLCGN